MKDETNAMEPPIELCLRMGGLGALSVWEGIRVSNALRSDRRIRVIVYRADGSRWPLEVIPDQTGDARQGNKLTSQPMP